MTEPTLADNSPTVPISREYTIDELSQAAGMTVRNVRAYQDKGLIPPPEIRGRTGIYSSAHLARLRVIGPLLARGYSLGNIAELIGAWEKGHDLHQLLGLEQAITTPWSEDVPAYYELSELMAMFPRQLSPEVLAKAGSLKLIVVDGARFKVPSPRLFNAGIELVALGVPLNDLLDILAGVRNNVEQVANALVQLVVKYVFGSIGQTAMPTSEQVAQYSEVIWRLRSVADRAVSSEVSAAMEKATQKYLGERMDDIMALIKGKAKR